MTPETPAPLPQGISVIRTESEIGILGLRYYVTVELNISGVENAEIRFCVPPKDYHSDMIGWVRQKVNSTIVQIGSIEPMDSNVVEQLK